MHRLTWHKHGLAEDKLLEFFISALLEMKTSLILQDLDLNYLCVTGLPERWRLEAGADPTDIGIFGKENGAKLEEMKRQIIQSGEKDELELVLANDCVFQFKIHTFAALDNSVYVVTAILDRSEDVRRERLLRALLREVSHRSKNLLAIIQSIASQTARYSGSLDGFLTKFRGRLYSLSQSQDLITDSSWRGTYFVELLRQQTDKYLPENSDLIEIRGEDPLLSPNASLHLGLALHELVVNAVSHGDIMRTGQKIVVECHGVEVDGREQIRVSWIEPRRTGDEAIAERGSAGPSSFGSTVLERVVPASVGGIAHYSLLADEIRYDLTFPVETAE